MLFLKINQIIYLALWQNPWSNTADINKIIKKFYEAQIYWMCGYSQCSKLGLSTNTN